MPQRTSPICIMCYKIIPGYTTSPGRGNKPILCSRACKEEYRELPNAICSYMGCREPFERPIRKDGRPNASARHCPPHAKTTAAHLACRWCGNEIPPPQKRMDRNNEPAWNTKKNTWSYFQKPDYCSLKCKETAWTYPGQSKPEHCPYCKKSVYVRTDSKEVAVRELWRALKDPPTTHPECWTDLRPQQKVAQEHLEFIRDYPDVYHYLDVLHRHIMPLLEVMTPAQQHGWVTQQLHMTLIDIYSTAAITSAAFATQTHSPLNYRPSRKRPFHYNQVPLTPKEWAYLAFPFYPKYPDADQDPENT